MTRRAICFLAVNSSYSHTNLADWYLRASTADMGWTWTTVELIAGENFHTALNRVAAVRPAVIAATFYVFNRVSVLSILRRHKAMFPGCIVIAGGPEFLGDNRAFFASETCVDAVVRGEGETAFRRLLSNIDHPERRVEVPGVCGVVNGRYFDNGLAEVVENLDDIPSPYATTSETSVVCEAKNLHRRGAKGAKGSLSDLNSARWNPGRSQLPAAPQGKENQKPFIQIETARGCRNKCAFCTSGGGRVRYFSPDRVRSDLALIHAAGFRSVRIVDRTFNENRRRCVELMRMFREEFGDMSFHLEIDPSLIGDEVLREMGVASGGQMAAQCTKSRMSRAEIAERTVDFEQDNGQSTNDPASLFGLRKAGVLRATPDARRMTPDARRMTPDARRMTHDARRMTHDARRMTLHLDVGVQSFSAKVLRKAGRSGQAAMMMRGLRALCGLKTVAVHADLIAGLPGATIQQTFEDLRKLVAVGPAEIQLELLKLLPGTRLDREREKFGIVASPEQPYEVLMTRDMSVDDVHVAFWLSKLVDWFYEPESLRGTVRAASRLWPRFWQELVAFCCARPGLSGTPGIENRFRLMDEFLARPVDIDEEESDCLAQSSRRAQRRTRNSVYSASSARDLRLRQSLRYAWMKWGFNPAGGICEARPWKEPVPADATLVEGDARAEVCRMFAVELDGPHIFAYGRKDVGRQAVAVWRKRVTG